MTTPHPEQRWRLPCDGNWDGENIIQTTIGPATTPADSSVWLADKNILFHLGNGQDNYGQKTVWG